MSFQTTNTAIRSLFENGWGESTPVDYGDDESFTKPQTAWLEFKILNNTERRAALSEEYFLALGIVVIKIFTPQFQTDAERMLLVDQASTIFRSKVASGIRFYDITPTKSGVRDGWHQINLNVSFEADHFY